MNQCHGWAEPMDVERAQDVHDNVEAANSGVNFYFTRCRLVE